MNRKFLNLLLIMLSLSAACTSERQSNSPPRDERPTSDPTLPLADLGFLRASDEVQRAKLRMASPAEAFRLYVLYDREFDSGWRITKFLAEHRLDMVPVAQDVLLDSTSTIAELCSALALVTWMHGAAGTYDVVRDEDLMAAVVSAEERVVAKTNLPKQWSQLLADIEDAKLKARLQQD